MLKSLILAIAITALTASTLDEPVDDTKLAELLTTDVQLDADTPGVVGRLVGSFNKLWKEKMPEYAPRFLQHLKQQNMSGSYDLFLQRRVFAEEFSRRRRAGIRTGHGYTATDSGGSKKTSPHPR